MMAGSQTNNIRNKSGPQTDCSTYCFKMVVDTELGRKRRKETCQITIQFVNNTGVKIWKC